MSPTSYRTAPPRDMKGDLVRGPGFEPGTSRLSAECSSQLSYPRIYCEHYYIVRFGTISMFYSSLLRSVIAHHFSP
jgi:hypothetical protein